MCFRGGYIGFLKQQNRVNVMLSRAKHGMYLVSGLVKAKREAFTGVCHKDQQLQDGQPAMNSKY